MRPTTKRALGCRFRDNVLERIAETSQPGNFLDIVNGILMMPQILMALARELHRLNGNLEEMQQSLGKLTNVVIDMRAMVAPLLGFKVVKEGRDPKREIG